ncbi:hypothetical protein [Bradyrhizobium neotropicale]|uniref:hypothetical protein n=1 Tax=Bradyrhizobium neotropicale TaxID=1497615 RepID=UPI001AD6D884|nr:hypothetical protein [Bradyrhizobium neotropicale]MBO4227902.1 hypothetical protein [Bradyrhizobium neotropicale]
MARDTVRYSDPQRFAGIFQMREFGVLLEARQDAHAGIGDHKLKDSVRGGVSDQPGLRSAAMLVDILLQFTQRTHQTVHQPARQPRRHGCVLSVTRPLLPMAVVCCRIKSSQRKDTCDIASTAAADVTGGDTLLHLPEEGRRNADGSIGRWRGPSSDCQFDQRPNPTRAPNSDRAATRQPAGLSLPEKIVSNLKGRRERDIPIVAQLRPRRWSHISRQPGQAA